MAVEGGIFLNFFLFISYIPFQLLLPIARMYGGGGVLMI